MSSLLNKTRSALQTKTDAPTITPAHVGAAYATRSPADAAKTATVASMARTVIEAENRAYRLEARRLFSAAVGMAPSYHASAGLVTA